MSANYSLAVILLGQCRKGVGPLLLPPPAFSHACVVVLQYVQSLRKLYCRPACFIALTIVHVLQHGILACLYGPGKHSLSFKPTKSLSRREATMIYPVSVWFYML